MNDPARKAVLSAPTHPCSTGAVPVEGGMPLIADGKIIGAIGLSGDTSDYDGQCAIVGAAVIK